MLTLTSNGASAPQLSGLEISSRPINPTPSQLGDQVSNLDWRSPTAYGINNPFANLLNPKLAQNTWNSYENAKDRLFQEYMSNTAYQRATEDMKKAGLNPYLAYDQGGASAPGGGTSHSTATGSGLIGDIVKSAFQLAIKAITKG